jgi:hypothetical protein
MSNARRRPIRSEMRPQRGAANRVASPVTPNKSPVADDNRTRSTPSDSTNSAKNGCTRTIDIWVRNKLTIAIPIGPRSA